MKLSILDQSPINPGATSRQALQASVELAQLGEQLGYTRYWIAEHHGMETLASSVPEVMLAYIGNQTTKIRIGAGAILLPHYKPYKVAETFNMLSTLFPNRIDLGIGRAPGGSAEASIALSGNFLENVRKMPDALTELIHFLNNDFSEDHLFSKTKATPTPLYQPELWLLGTSIKSAFLAAEKGISYAFGAFMSESNGGEILQSYKENFTSTSNLKEPYSMITVHVICAETREQADVLAFNQALSELEKPTIQSSKQIENTKKSLTNEEIQVIKKVREKRIIGNSAEVKEQLLSVQQQYKPDEIMIVTLTDTYESRKKSYQLVADVLL